MHMKSKKTTKRTLLSLCAALSLAFLPVPRAMAEIFNSNGVTIHYTVTGSGEPVILIHGLTSSIFMNWQLPGTIRELSKHYEVIALDNRGHGQSDKPTDPSDYGVNMVEDVVRLMDHLHIQKAHVVGYSLGGIIIMKMLTMHPERVSSAVLGGMGWLRAGSALNDIWGDAPARNGRRAAISACTRGTAQLATTEAEVRAIKVPVTMLVGDRDPTRKMYVMPLQQIRPDWPVHLISGAGHLNCVGKPEFKEQLEKALASHPMPVTMPVR
jgi:pimeloyl-ACP methyl ester carboxylesterase